MTEIELLRSGSWSAIDYQEFEIELGVSDVKIAPTATIRTGVHEDVSPGQDIRIRENGSTIFRGSTESGGRREMQGGRRVEAGHKAYRLFGESVDISVTSPTSEGVLQAALSAASLGGDFTLSYSGSATSLGDDYEASDRDVKDIFRDMMDRTSRVWRVDPVSDVIRVEPVGNRGVWQSIDTQADSASVLEYDEGDVSTVRNDVRVTGTGGEAVTGSASDSSSISSFGRQDDSFNVEYIRSTGEANAMASELLIPAPLAEGTVLVGKNVGDVTQSLVNHSITLTDTPKGITSETLVVEKQRIEQGRAELKVGEGSGVSLENHNRKAKSTRDVTEPGTVMPTERISDGAVVENKLADIAVTVDKIRDAAIAEAKVRQAAITETKISDNAISTPKLQAGSVKAGTIDSAVVDTIHLAADAVDAGVIQADAVGASEIAARTILAGHISSGTITANEIDANTITANEIDARTILAGNISSGTITANEISANTITAGEIDSLLLDSDEIRVGMDANNQIRFATADSGGTTVMRPTSGGTCMVGTAFDPFDTVNANNFSGGEADFSGGLPLYVAPDGASEDLVFETHATNSTDPVIRPTASIYGQVGTSSNYFYRMHAEGFTTHTPPPITDEDVDLSALDAVSFDDPPGYVKRATAEDDRPDPTGDEEEAARDSGGDAGEEDLAGVETDGVEIGAMSNYLLGVCRAQQELIDELQDRVTELEPGSRSG